MNKKISFPIAIIIIVVCAVLVGGIVVWQYYGIPKEEEEAPGEKLPKDEIPEDETADWKTYRNEEYGFEIKYPEDWSAYDGTENDCFAEHSCLSSLNLISPIATGWISVDIFDNSEKLLHRDWLEKYKLGKIKEEKFIDEIEVGGNNGIRLRYTPIARGYMLNYIYLSREEFIYEMSFITEIDNPPEIENAIDQILSTFKFLE